MQQFLKPPAGFAGARVIAAELLDKFLAPVYDAVSAFDTGFGWESLAAFTCGLETSIGRGLWLWSS